jgi:hypothetical protein
MPFGPVFGLPKGAAGSGSRDAAGKQGEEGRGKTRGGGGGLINSGWRTYAPHVLGLGRDQGAPKNQKKKATYLPTYLFFQKISKNTSDFFLIKNELIT